MIPTYEQVGAIVCSVLIIISVLGLGGAGSVAATDHSQNSTQVDVDSSDLAGSGTEADPYQITNASELQAVEDDLDAHYELITDIDASGTTQWNNGKGFDPIGGNPNNNTTPPAFTGSLEGNNQTITGLTIDRRDESFTGIFGVNSGELADVSVTNLSVTGEFRVGGFAGENRVGTITNTTASGGVTGREIAGVASPDSFPRRSRLMGSQRWRHGYI